MLYGASSGLTDSIMSLSQARLTWALFNFGRTSGRLNRAQFGLTTQNRRPIGSQLACCACVE